MAVDVVAHLHHVPGVEQPHQVAHVEGGREVPGDDHRGLFGGDAGGGAPLLREALGEFAALLGPEADPAFAAFLVSLPVVKLPAMVPGSLTSEELDALLAEVSR